VSGDEVAEALSKLVVCLVLVSFDSPFLDGPVHHCDLAIDPWVPRLGEAMIDLVLGTGQFERVRPKAVRHWR